MRVVVLGTAGLIGSRTVARLRDHRAEAVPVSRADDADNVNTGQGLQRTVHGADMIVDVTDAPHANRRPVRRSSPPRRAVSSRPRPQENLVGHATVPYALRQPANRRPSWLARTSGRRPAGPLFGTALGERILLPGPHALLSHRTFTKWLKRC
jgi:hypothetical protein